MRKIICHIFNHRWVATDNKRTCMRCGQKEQSVKIEFTKLGEKMFKKTII